MDHLGRCGTAFAVVGPESIPTESRGSISQVRPSGWDDAKYDFIDRGGGNLYHRSHLILQRVSGEDANARNLITGTEYLNIEGMLPFETQILNYVKSTGCHVAYRVTPIFDGNNLVADGVEMEAMSIEDKGNGLMFHVYCHNVQPGVIIDYSDGSNRKA